MQNLEYFQECLRRAYNGVWLFAILTVGFLMELIMALIEHAKEIPVALAALVVSAGLLLVALIAVSHIKKKIRGLKPPG